jgi:hypothetical protein
MCWNAEVSLNTFIFSSFALLFSIFNNNTNILVAIYFISYVSMQLLEYFIWEGYNNRLLSQIGLLIILLQPILSNLRLDFSISKYVYALYGVFLITVFTVIKPLNTINFKSLKAENGHLAWHWLDLPWYVCILWVLFELFPFLYNKEYYKFIFWILIFLVIYIIYLKTNTWGSMFCWFANIYALKLIFSVFYNNYCSFKI